MSVHPLSLRRFAMVHSFLRAAVDALDDPVLRETEARKAIDTDESGKPLAPNALAQAIGQLGLSEGARLVSSCCVAAANLGYAYEHAFRLVNYLETGKNTSLPSRERRRLDRLYDDLPDKVRRELDTVYESVESHEFDIQESFGEVADRSPDPPRGIGSSAFRRELNYWESQRLLQRSHAKYADADLPFQGHILIPLRSVEIVDRILASVLAPRLGLGYTRMTGEVALVDNPKVEWKDQMLVVSLPDKRGRVMEARWKPTIISVIRIRRVGEEKWSVGFETPLNGCSFVGLDPGVEYEVKVTHKNAVGEGEPAYLKVRPDGEGSPPR